MAGQILWGAVTSDPQMLVDGSAILNDGGSGERSASKTVGFAFATIQQTTPQVWPNGDSYIATDLPYTATFPYVIFRAERVPNKFRLRPFQINLSVLGQTAWTTLTGLAIQDTSVNQGVLTYIPASALVNEAVISLPIQQRCATLQLAVTAYNAQTGVITFAGSSLINATLAGFPFRVVAGTGSAQQILGTTVVSGIIGSATASTITPNALPAVALDTTSVVEVPYWIATASSATSITASNGTFTANALAAGGFYVTIVAGTGAGQTRLITANTSTALTVPTWSTTPDTTSVFLVTSNPNSGGVFDCGVGQLLPIFGKGAGIAIGQYGTAPGAGSNIRVFGFGII